MGGDIKILKYASRHKPPGRRGRSLLCSFLEVERNEPVCRGKYSYYGDVWVIIKNAVLGVSRSKNTQIFPYEAFLLFVAAVMFLEVALFLESYPVLKTPGSMPGWLPWLVDKGNFWLLDQLNIHLFNNFILSNLSILKLIFHSHDTKNLYTQIYFNSSTNVHI